MLQRKDLTGDDPAERTPCGGEKEDVNADKGDRGLLGCNVVDYDVTGAVLACRKGAQHGDNKLADTHANGAPEKEGTAAPFVDGIQAWDGRCHVDRRGDHSDDEGVGDAGVFEELGAVIEDEVDSCLVVRVPGVPTFDIRPEGEQEAARTYQSAAGGPGHPFQ